MTDLYALLAVQPDADPATIHAAYRTVAKAAHPDAGGDRAAWDRLTLAHAVLSDDKRRAAYDATGSTAEPEPDRALAQAAGWLARALDDTVKRASDNREPLARIDIVARMRGALDRWAKEARAVLAAMEREQKQFAEMRERFGGEDIMRGIVAARLEALDNARTRTEADLAGFAMARRLLERVTYRQDAAPQMVF